MSTRRPEKARIQFMSDLHLERIKYDFDVSKAAPTLALVGDIGRFHDYDGYSDFLRKQCAEYEQVLLVAGNHEFYGSSRDEGLHAAQNIVEDLSMEGKLVLMNRTRVDIAGSNIVVLGCTLHSYIGPDYTRLTNDFERIRDWRVKNHNEEHQLDKEWLQESLRQIAQTEPKKQVIILTHYAPSFQNTCHPMHEDNPVSRCFCSNTLEAFKDWEGSQQVSDWVFGHTHWNARFMCGSTVVQSNCLLNDSRNLSWLQKRKLYRPFDNQATIDERSTQPWYRLLNTLIQRL